MDLGDMDVSTSRQILDKYDEILTLCGAKPEELISSTLSRFLKSVETEVRSAPQVKDFSEEEVKSTTVKMQEKLTNDVMLLIAISIGTSLKATGQAFGKMAEDKQAMKKAADEWFSKFNG